MAATLAALLFFVPVAHTWAQGPGVGAATVAKPDRPLWHELTPGQQTVLAPIERTWDENDGQRKRKWVELAARYPRMSADEQANAQKRIADWAKLTPTERRAARQNFQAAQQVDPDRRAAKWEAYQALPEAEKRRLAEQRAAKAVAPKATAAPAPIPRPQAAKPGEPGHNAQSGRREPARLAGSGAEATKAPVAAANPAPSPDTTPATLAPKQP
jgi:hypothetical protein